ncbi:hypothetical protein [Streptomyces sp. NPDC059142]|uniref:hypothetical protein n=1 Tax=Streptomyces sp. NPDC059142 TaxID=3346739 RepID=UPI0036A298D8
MSSAGKPQEEAAAPVAPVAAATVLYVCADRGTVIPSLAADRAEEEGRAFAQRHGLLITEVVADEFGEPDPARRKGWRRVRELAAAGAVASVLVRWPAAIAPESASEHRHHETSWLQKRGVRVRYTWEPLAKRDGDTR